jgi:AmmeMemoRadiSam system protein B/AmmeMemoRadiSam system protein A
MKKYFFKLLLFFMLGSLSCTSQDNKKSKGVVPEYHNLKPAFAGQFYPAEKSELEATLKNMFAKAGKRKINNALQAIIVPHAGYVFSGVTAASAYDQIDPERLYENVFLITSSHHEYFKGASIYLAGNCETPLGEVVVNFEVSKKMVEVNDIFSYVPEAHFSEHSAEVQLPFLQYKLKNSFKIIPIVIGTQSKEDCMKIAKALKPWFNENNLFVISSDFSHYPDYENAVMLDKKIADAVISNNIDIFLAELTASENRNIQGLATRACGWTSILTLMNLTRGNPQYVYNKISYTNSGDSEYGDKYKVVGYNAIGVSIDYSIPDGNKFNLSVIEKRALLDIARTAIDHHICQNKVDELFPENYSETLRSNMGAFVTLKKDHNLKGCIGRFDASEPLYKLVQQMAIASATQDSRFLPVSKDELKEIEIEISVLTPLEKINSIDQIVLGKHGIYLVKGNRTGTFLPQVAVETGWNLEEFLGHCSRDKAGIGWEGWKDAELFIYEALVFSEEELE